MKSNDTDEFKILFRHPELPLIIISRKKLLSGFDFESLTTAFSSAKPVDNDKGKIIAIDSTGEEFWYHPQLKALAPGFAFKKWTKKKIIDLYNRSPNAKRSKAYYSQKSLSSKKLSRIVYEICELIRQ